MQDKWQTIFTTQLWEHTDTDVTFSISAQNDDHHVADQPLLDAGHFLAALWLSGVPFIVIYSDYNKGWDIGWGVHLAEVDDWQQVIDARINSKVLTFDYDNPVGILLDNIIDAAYELENLHLYFIKEI